MDRKKRSKELGYLFVVGGPGGSGASTISKMLSKHFNLKRIYAGGLFRERVNEKGYDNFENYFTPTNEDDLIVIDREVDHILIRESNQRDVLIDSKLFAGISYIKGIPCTVKIWLDASLHRRALRHVNKREYKRNIDKLREYIKTRRDLKKRWRLDSKGYFKLYGIDYSKQKVYNDIVIDSSNMNEEETFKLILKKLEDGRYIKKE